MKLNADPKSPTFQKQSSPTDDPFTGLPTTTTYHNQGVKQTQASKVLLSLLNHEIPPSHPPRHVRPPRGGQSRSQGASVSQCLDDVHFLKI